ncbi:unnamed protein product [Closterium sp. NIES-54]
MSMSDLLDLLGSVHAMYADVDSSAPGPVCSHVHSLGACNDSLPVASIAACVDSSPGATSADASVSFTLDSDAFAWGVMGALTRYLKSPFIPMLVSGIPSRVGLQKMGRMGVNHRDAHDPHDQAYAVLNNPILLWGLQKRPGLADALLATESSENARAKLTPAVGVKTSDTTPTSALSARVVINDHQKEDLSLGSKILQRFGLQFSTAQPTPLAVDHRLTDPFPDEPFESSGPYAELVGCLMSTRSSSVAQSSTETEIYVAAMAAQELRWLTFLLTDLGEQPSFALPLFADNRAMILLCREP